MVVHYNMIIVFFVLNLHRFYIYTQAYYFSLISDGDTVGNSIFTVQEKISEYTWVYRAVEAFRCSSVLNN